MKLARQREMVDGVRTAWQVCIRERGHCRSTARASIVVRGAPSTRPLARDSRRSPRRGCGMAIAASKHCFDASTGGPIDQTTKGRVSIARWAFSCATIRPSVWSRPRCNRAAQGAKAANNIRAMQNDQLFDGTKIDALTLVDVLSRASSAIGIRQELLVGPRSSRRSSAALGAKRQTK